MTRITCLLGTALVLALALSLTAEDAAPDKDARIAALEARVTQLESELAALREQLGPLLEQARAQQRQQHWALKARQRMAKDREAHSGEELRKIERLYQTANRNWRSPEAREAMKQLVENYKDVNRTGCAMLYLARMSTGDERGELLTKAMEEYADCFYGDGTQVGPYAMFLLGVHLRESGDDDTAQALFDTLRAEAPDAIKHGGQRLVDLLE